MQARELTGDDVRAAAEWAGEKVEASIVDVAKDGLMDSNQHATETMFAVAGLPRQLVVAIDRITGEVLEEADLEGHKVGDLMNGASTNLVLAAFKLGQLSMTPEAGA